MKITDETFKKFQSHLQLVKRTTNEVKRDFEIDLEQIKKEDMSNLLKEALVVSTMLMQDDYHGERPTSVKDQEMVWKRVLQPGASHYFYRTSASLLSFGGWMRTMDGERWFDGKL